MVWKVLKNEWSQTSWNKSWDRGVGGLNQTEFKFCATWCCVFGWMAPNISNVGSAFIFKGWPEMGFANIQRAHQAK